MGAVVSLKLSSSYPRIACLIFLLPFFGRREIGQDNSYAGGTYHEEQHPHFPRHCHRPDHPPHR